MRGTEILTGEHRVIEQVLCCLEKLAYQARAAKILDRVSADGALDFLRNFADGCHLHKEEECLFPMLEERGFPRQGGPTGVMLHEHEEGRKRIRAMTALVDRAAKGEREAIERFAHHAQAYANLIRRHIRKEDMCLFPMTDQTLSSEDQAELVRQFESADDENVATGNHEKYLRLADELADRFDVPKTAHGVYC